MMFSILVANYNNGRFFDDCYRSIISQTAGNWEVVVLDDASTDNSVEIIKNKIEGDSRFRFFENEENKGVAFTKGKLIELSLGDFFAYVDPDDAILPTAIEKSLSVFEHNPKVVLTYSRFMACDGNLNPISPFKNARQVENNNPYFFNCPIVINHFVCFRKKIYGEIEKINPDLRIAEDQDLYLKFYEKGKVYFINETNYLYRFHAGGISQNQNKKKSYEYWGKVVWDAMKRRKLTRINGKKIPEKYTSSKEIFDLLAYQNSIFRRMRKKILLSLNSFFHINEV